MAALPQRASRNFWGPYAPASFLLILCHTHTPVRGLCWWICWNHRPQGLALAVSQLPLRTCHQPLLAVLLPSFQSEFFLDLQACTPKPLLCVPIPTLSRSHHCISCSESGWPSLRLGLYSIPCYVVFPVPTTGAWYTEGHHFICGIIEATALARQLRAHPLLLVIQDCRAHSVGIYKCLLTHSGYQSTYSTFITK